MTIPDDPNQNPAPGAGEPPTEPLGSEPPAGDPPPPGENGPRRLTRSTADRVVGGVSGGLARYFGIDPIIFRIAFVVLAFAGGTGILAYAALWLFVPDDTPGAQPPAGRSRSGLVAAGVVLVLAAIVVTDGPFGFFFGSGLLVAGLIVAAVVALVMAARGEGGDATKVLVRTTIVLGSVVGAVVVAAAGALAAATGGGVLVAGLVVVAGLLLLAGAFAGGARWLILPALALAGAMAFVAAADIEVEGGVGERRYRPATVHDIRDSYRHGIGQLTVDLRDVDFPAGDHVIDVGVGMGEVRVLLPEEVCAAARARIGMGVIALYGTGSEGIDVEFDEQPAAPAGIPRVLVDADLGLGEVLVGSDSRLMRDHDHHSGGRPWQSDWREDDGARGNDACEDRS